MAEALGALSAATALVEQGGKAIKFVSDVYSQYKHPEEKRKQLHQIQQLVDLAERVKLNPSLQTDGVASILSSCCTHISMFKRKLDNVSVEAGIDVGRRERSIKALKSVVKDKDVEKLFLNLEREKVALVLAIVDIDSSLLHSLGLSVEETAIIARSIAVGVDELRLLLIARFNLDDLPPIPQLANPVSKTYFEVPNRATKNFVGREDVLKRVTDGLMPSSGTRIVVLRGLGGQGKSQIALEHCRRAAKMEHIRAIFWIDASSDGSVKKSFQTIAAKIRPGQPIPDDATNTILETFREWPERWLMVFDNYDDAKAFGNIEDFFPQSDKGAILVTSRHTASDSLTDDPDNVIELLGLSEGESLQLLFKQCRLRPTGPDLDHAKAIVARLAYHPLAITQAGSYNHSMKIPLNQFMDKYNQQKEIILKNIPTTSRYRRKLSEEEDETSLSVFTTFELSFQQLAKDAPSGKTHGDLLTLFGFFDNKDISGELFSSYCQRAQIWPQGFQWPVECLAACLGTEYADGQFLSGWYKGTSLNGTQHWDKEIFAGIVNSLTETSLVQSWNLADDEHCHLTLHPLIKDWIRLRISPDDFRHYSLIASKVLEAMLSNNYRQESFKFSLPMRQILLSHVDAYVENIDMLQELNLVSSKDWKHSGLQNADHWVGNFLDKCGRYHEYEIIATRAVDFSTNYLGMEHEDTLECMSNLGGAFSRQGKLDQAESLYQKVIEGRQNLLGPDDARTLSVTTQLVWLMLQKGNYEEAERLSRATSELQEKKFGLNQHTLTSLQILGESLSALGRLDESEEILRRVLDCREELLEPDHDETLKTLSALGEVLYENGDLTSAEEIERRVLESREKSFGKDHPQTMIAVHNLALSLRELGRLEEAEIMTRRSIEGQARSRGWNPGGTLMSIWTLATILKDQEKYEESQNLWPQAIGGLTKALGKEHPSTIKCSLQYDKMMKALSQRDLDNGETAAELLE